MDRTREEEEEEDGKRRGRDKRETERGDRRRERGEFSGHGVIRCEGLGGEVSTPPCTYVRYSSLEDVRPQELGFHQLEFTPIVVSKIRISAPFQVAAVALVLAATISALIGHCYSDHRTLVACGLFLLSGKLSCEIKVEQSWPFYKLYY
ncbi:hypothetical protein HZU73_04993 [Apis mellifera caucasica]|nr:hypothetical protein HZU73_04993 [Apis mellifera caucasica]